MRARELPETDVTVAERDLRADPVRDHLHDPLELGARRCEVVRLHVLDGAREQLLRLRRGRLLLRERGPYRDILQVDGEVAKDSAALRHLWARHRIQSLTDQESLEGGEAQRQRITELGLRYSLLTQYTSFLAVDHIVRNTQPADTPSVNQPLPMPQGVSNLAVGAEVPGTPEPETWGAMSVMLSVLAMVLRRARRNRRDRFTA